MKDPASRVLQTASRSPSEPRARITEGTAEHRRFRQRVVRAAAALAFFATSIPSLATDGRDRGSRAAPPATAEEADRRLGALEERKKSTATELDQVLAEEKVVRARKVVRGRAYYKAIRAGFLPVGGGFDALVDHAVRVERLRQGVLQDAQRELELGRRAKALRADLADLEVQRGPLVVQRDALRKARAALQEVEERRTAFERAFDRSVRPDHVAIYGAGLGPSDEGGAKSFASQKGRLAFPIGGRAEVRKERRANGPGLFFSAPAGTAVRAVAAGRVVYADAVAGYGRVVLLDHGDRWYSLYAELQGIDVKVGETVGSGGRLGETGVELDASGRGGAGLWFEIRRGPEAVDPASWMGL